MCATGGEGGWREVSVSRFLPAQERRIPPRSYLLIRFDGAQREQPRRRPPPLGMDSRLLGNDEAKGVSGDEVGAWWAGALDSSRGIGMGGRGRGGFWGGCDGLVGRGPPPARTSSGLSTSGPRAGEGEALVCATGGDGD